jgi:hypothetical protein
MLQYMIFELKDNENLVEIFVEKFFTCRKPLNLIIFILKYSFFKSYVMTVKITKLKNKDH